MKCHITSPDKTLDAPRPPGGPCVVPLITAPGSRLAAATTPAGDAVPAPPPRRPRRLAALVQQSLSGGLAAPPTAPPAADAPGGLVVVPLLPAPRAAGAESAPRWDPWRQLGAPPAAAGSAADAALGFSDSLWPAADTGTVAGFTQLAAGGAGRGAAARHPSGGSLGGAGRAARRSAQHALLQESVAVTEASSFGEWPCTTSLHPAAHMPAPPCVPRASMAKAALDGRRRRRPSRHIVPARPPPLPPRTATRDILHALHPHPTRRHGSLREQRQLHQLRAG